MGIADVLVMMGLRYGSEEAMPLVERIYRSIRDAAYDESAEIAAEKGPFPKFDREKYLRGEFIRELPEEIRGKIARHGIRNAVLLTQAPTGTTSSLAGVNSGIEPVFAFVAKRTDRLGEHVLYHPLARDWKDAHPDEDLPGYFVTAGDLTPEEHVRMQALFQAYTCASISKTLNGPSTDTVEDVERLYMLAYDTGCKGITYYRQGSRDAVLEAVAEKKAGKAGEAAEAPATVAAPQLTAVPKKRPEVLSGQTRQVRAPEGKVNITLNCDPDTEELFEMFINLGKAGSDISAMAEALGRLISFNLQMPSPMSQTERAREMADQLRGIGGSRAVGIGPNQVKSLPDGVGLALGKYVEAATQAPVPAAHLQGEPAPIVGSSHEADAAKAAVATGAFCPSCRNATMVRIEGCRKCLSCGHSEC
jgi:ribonucleoside-diphosphate reductase alpha chain